MQNAVTSTPKLSFWTARRAKPQGAGSARSVIGAAAVLSLSLVGVQLGAVTSSQAAPASGPGLLSATSPGVLAAGVVPDGTCRATMTALGGAGSSSGLSASTGGAGGAAARLTATYEVLAGQAYGGEVGGGGTTSAGGSSGPTTGAGGAPGVAPAGHRGGGGGGRTTFSIAGQTLLTAGAGGGGGGAHQAAPAGNGGAAGVPAVAGVVAPGSNGANGVDQVSNGGGSGGGTAAGGAGGVNGSSATFNGIAGGGIGNGSGGAGGADVANDSAGGGGGGYTGGGGGASTFTNSVTGAGGGGGSSFIFGTSPVPSANSVSALASQAGPTPTAASAAGANGSVTVDWKPCVYDLALTKSVSPTTITAGQTATWTVKVTNNGPDPMTKGDTVDLSDTLPTGPNGPASPAYKVVSLSTSGGANANMASGPVTCTGVTVGASMPPATECSRPYSAPAALGAPTGGTRGLNVGESLTIVYEQEIAQSATCPKTITNVATIKDRPSSGGTATDVTGNTVIDTVNAPLAITCSPTIKLVKSLAGPRINASDQFVMAISPGGAAASGGSTTTAGSGSSITAGTGSATVPFAVSGLTYTFNESMAAGSASVISQYPGAVTCINSAVGSSTTLPAAGSKLIPFSITPSGSDNITCTLTNTPVTSTLTIVKSAVLTPYTAVGATIAYSFVVTNVSPIVLTAITVTDPKATGISCPSSSLASSAQMTCTGRHIVTQADLDAGSVTNTAAVVSTPPGGTPYPPIASNTVVVNGTQTPQLSIGKSTTKLNYSTVGETIPYSFTVNNTGNVTLTAVSVTDVKTSGVTCTSSTLAAGASTTCSGSHIVTQADLNSGSVSNTATVVGTPPTGPPLSPTSSNTVVVPAIRTPKLSITKASSTPSFNVVGQNIGYSFTVKNTGNVTMTSVTVSDANATSAITCLASVLIPGASTTCSATHAVVLSDLNSGSVVNTAAVVGTDPTNTVSAPVSSNTVTVPAVQTTALTVVKATTATKYDTLGASIPYTFTVTNNGNVTITGVTVTDPKATGISCNVSSLNPGAVANCSGSHVVTQADLDGTSVVNTASVVGTPPSGIQSTPTASNTVTVPSDQKPKLTITKLAGVTAVNAVGQSVPYTFTVTNTGNVSVKAVTVIDPKTSGVTCDVTRLAPLGVATCTGSHVVTQADLDAGLITNTASATGTPPTGVALAPVNSNTVNVTATQNPALSVSKASRTKSFDAAGQTLDYTFVVKNTGNVTMTGVSVSDPIVGAVTCDVSTLSPGATAKCTASYLTVLTDVLAAKVDNVASATGNPPAGVAITPVSSNVVSIPLDPLPELTIEKSSPTADYSTLNEVVTYSFVVKNVGNVPVSSVAVTDPNTTSVSCAVTSLGLNASTTCTASHTVTQTDLDAGTLINTASVTANPPTGGPIGPITSNTVSIPATQTGQLSIEKRTTTVSAANVGDVVSYTFEVTNPGNVTMTSVTVSDPNVTALRCDATTITPGELIACSAEHVVTQSDLDAGKIDNTASVVGTPPNGKPIPAVASNLVSVPVIERPSLSIAKASLTTNYSRVGDVISYTFVVENTGNVTMSSIVITDPKVAEIVCPVTTLAPGATMSCTASRTATLADLNSGSVVNTANVAGTAPSGSTITPVASNTVTVNGVQTPRLSVVKSTAKASFTATSEAIPYSFVVTNTGNVTVTSVTVTDPIAGLIVCAQTSLNPGESTTCTGTRLAKQSDLDGGSIMNTASVSGKGPQGASLPASGSNTVTVPAVQAPRLTIVKSTTKTSIGTVGERINYKFRVENTGNVTLTAVSVSDPIAGPVTCLATTLTPGQGVDCSATRTVSQSDLDAGSVVNSASVVGTPPSGVPMAPVGSNTITVTAAQSPSLSIVKATTATTYSAVNDTISYTFEVKNTGNVTITSINVSDPNATGITCAAASVAPGATVNCTGVHTVTQADIDSGKVINTATVTGTAPGGTPLAPVQSNTVQVKATQTPNLEIVKSSPVANYSSVGQVISYEFVVTNTGNVTMSGITILDAKVSGVSCPRSILAPGENTTCTGTHVATQGDLDAGSIVNTAAVTATPPGGSPITPLDSNTVTLTALANPSLKIVKSVSHPPVSAVNENVTYSFSVTNDGNVTMHDIVVTDPKVVGIGCGASILAPGDSTNCTGAHLVTQAELDSPSIINVASVGGKAPSGTAISPVSSNTVTLPTAQKPGLSVSKATTTGSYKAVGDIVTYTFNVANTGNVTMTGVVINDPQLSVLSCVKSTLSGGDATTCTGSHTVIQADLDAGAIVNVATVGGTAPSGPFSPVPSNTVTVPAIISPDLTIVKSTSTANYANVGEQILFGFTVTNSGNVTLTNVAVTDPNATNMACPKNTLLTAESMICTAKHLVTLADLNRGMVANTAAVTAITPLGEALDPIPSNTVTVPAVINPGLAAVKSRGPGSITKAGDTISYAVLVTNSGNVTLSLVKVDDPIARDLSCPQSTLNPGEQTNCTGTHVVTQAEADAGVVLNTAFFTGVPPVGPPLAPQPTNTVETSIVPDPKFSLVKATTNSQFRSVGDVIVYTFEVGNTGNVTMQEVAVSDPNVSGVSCLRNTLAPGDTTVCSGSHVVTQADLDSGSVVNTASVTGVTPKGVTTAPTSSNTVTLGAVRSPAVSLVKSTTTASVAVLGARIAYRFEVTNKGNVTLSAVAVSDPNATNIICPLTTLAPSQATVCSGEHVVTQTDLDAGSIINIATVTATPPLGVVPLAPLNSNAVTVPVAQGPSVTIVKRVLETTFAAVGDALTYEFTVENTGNVTLTQVVVTDPLTTAVSCPATSLAPTAKTVCTAKRAVTQADLNTGKVVNTAELSALPPSGVRLPPVDSNEVTVNATQTPAMTVVKSSPTVTVLTAGTVVPYEFVITNTGNVTITNVEVSDPMISTLTCDKSDFDPGQKITCTGDHVVTQLEIDSGAVNNRASVVGRAPSGVLLPAVNSNVVTIPVDARPGIAIVKSTTSTGINTAGQVITYTFAITNTGNVTLANLALADPNATGLSCPVTALAPTVRTTCTGTHLVTLGDMNSGSVINSASVTATPPNGPAIPRVNSNTVTVPAFQSDTLSIEKSASPLVVSAIGDLITYTFKVTNNGNVTMSSIAVTDPLTTAPVCAETSLDPGASTTCRSSKTVTQADLDRGTIDNTASVSGQKPNGSRAGPISSNTVSVPATQITTMTIRKATTVVDYTVPGENVTYTFEVKNTGNVPLTDVVVEDRKTGAVTCAKLALAPNESTTCTSSLTVRAEDTIAGTIANTASVTGLTPLGARNRPTVSNTVSIPWRSQAVQVTPDTEVTSSTPPTGIGPSSTSTPSTAVRANASSISTASTAENVGDVSTTSLVGSATSPDGSATATSAGEIELKKSATSQFRAVGDTVVYTFELKNVGPTLVSDARILDTMVGLSAVDCGSFNGQLEPNQSVSCSATYRVTAADVRRGFIVNTASAEATNAKLAKVLADAEARSSSAAPGNLSLTGGNILHLVATAFVLVALGAVAAFVGRRRLR